MSGTRLFLLALATLYAGFAVWCSVKPRETAESLGYELPGPSGLCEFRVVYGGLELGLAAFFALGAFRVAFELPALWLALVLHATLVLFRAVIVMVSVGLSATIYTVFVLELVISVAAVWVAWSRGLP